MVCLIICLEVCFEIYLEHLEHFPTYPYLKRCYWDCSIYLTITFKTIENCYNLSLSHSNKKAALTTCKIEEYLFMQTEKIPESIFHPYTRVTWSHMSGGSGWPQLSTCICGIQMSVCMWMQNGCYKCMCLSPIVLCILQSPTCKKESSDNITWCVSFS
jgi:hypothetical protein